MEDIQEKEDLLRLAELSMQLDTYDDIFSDFDPRPYSIRAISDDFLFEAKRAVKEKKEEFELKFMIPEKLRDLRSEHLIKKRLHDYFKAHYDRLIAKKKGMMRKGIFLAIIGIVLMFLASIVLFKYNEHNIWTSFIVVLLEPAGWFLFWEGLSHAIFESKELSPDLNFFRKISQCEISFTSF